jgi:hypothetical protein
MAFWLACSWLDEKFGKFCENPRRKVFGWRRPCCNHIICGTKITDCDYSNDKREYPK